jgi:hypothetical protein
MRQPLYQYIGTVYHQSFFVPVYPYEDRPVYTLGPGGGHFGSGAPLSIPSNLPHYVADDTVPASYDQLPNDQGWKPGETNFTVGDDEYITCTREIRYFQFGNPADDTRIYIKSWDWYQYIGP